jgi:hypothetical protein
MSTTEQANVFISSILNVSLEDLLQERRVIREVVESHRFLKAWAFEKAPASFEDLDESYLRNVDECDIFVVIVGAEASNPVAAEVQRAKQKNKPILIFAKAVSNRKPMAQMLLDNAGRKYAPFKTIDELQHAVRDAIDHALVLGVRSLSATGRTPISDLRHLEEKKTHFHIQPMVPAFPAEHKFDIKDLSQKTATVSLHSSDESIAIPVSRISEVLSYGEGQTPVLTLDGRLQWVTTIQRWRFFPEKHERLSPLGLYKPSTTNDRRAVELCNRFRAQGFEPGWTYEAEVPSKLSATYQPVYDDDGLYFRIADRPDNLVLIIQRAGGTG